MNVSNAAYNKPTTVYKPGLQKEGIDQSIEGENSWYDPIEKVIPRVYHKYLKAEDLKNIYGPEKEEEDPDDEGEDNNQDDPNQNDNPPQDDPNQNSDPADPNQNTEPENPDTPSDVFTDITNP